MTRAEHGLTLLDLMIALAVFAILAAVGVPLLLGDRPSVNEGAAVATLRRLAAAQAKFRAGGQADADNDGKGEYGGFLELSGSGNGRMVTALNAPVLPGAFGSLNADGTLSRSGYLFRVFLGDKGGAGVGEPMAGYRNDDSLDADHGETTWCCYAWPADYGATGKRAFFINQSGVVLGTDDPAYRGFGGASHPAADAAFQTARRITGAVAIGIAGQDGNLWKRVP